MSQSERAFTRTAGNGHDQNATIIPKEVGLATKVEEIWKASDR